MSIPATDLADPASGTLLVLPGQSALSAFRLSKVLHELQRSDARIGSVDARYTYFVNTRSSLSATAREHLDALLLAQDSVVTFAKGAQVVLTVPRPGTISPWSSKATDIAHACGLDAIERIERGIAYAITSRSQLDAFELQTAGKMLFDRMTESLLEVDSGAQALFDTHAPAPLRRIPLLVEGADALRRANTELGLALSSAEIEYLPQN